MKIIHLTYEDTGGAHNAVYRIHKALLKKNINSQLWVNRSKLTDQTIKRSDSIIDRFLSNLSRYLVNYLLVRILKTKNKILHSPSVFPSRWLRKINNSSADIVHLHWVQGEMMSISDIGKINKPVVWTLHDMWAFCGAEHYTNDNRWREGYKPNNRPHHEWGFDLNRWTWERKKKYWKNQIAIATPSNWLAKCTKESKLMSSWQVSAIPNPIDTDRWKPLNKKVARKQFNLPQNIPLMLFGAMSGGKDPRKGFDLLLDSLHDLKKIHRIKELEIVVFGEKKTKSSPKIDFPIHYIGHLNKDSHLIAAYSAADVMVIPSRQDNLPSTAIEAHACGTPVVSFNIGGLPEIINHKKTGYIAKAFNTKDLANGIYWVLNQKKNIEINNNARRKAVKIFSEKKIAEDYLNLYKKILSK